MEEVLYSKSEEGPFSLGKFKEDPAVYHRFIGFVDEFGFVDDAASIDSGSYNTTYTDDSDELVFDEELRYWIEFEEKGALISNVSGERIMQNGDIDHPKYQIGNIFRMFCSSNGPCPYNSQMIEILLFRRNSQIARRQSTCSNCIDSLL